MGDRYFSFISILNVNGFVSKISRGFVPKMGSRQIAGSSSIICMESMCSSKGKRVSVQFLCNGQK